MNGFEGKGIQSGIIHGRGDGHGSGGKILYLLGIHMAISNVLGQKNHIFHGASRVAGHEIGYKILLFSRRLVDGIELLFKLLKDLHGRLAHAVGNLLYNVLRCNFQLAGDMVLAQLLHVA